MRMLWSLIILSLVNACLSQVIHVPNVDVTTCVGSLMFTTKSGDIKIITESLKKTFILMENVTMKGCGCFHIHSGRGGRGSKSIIYPGQRLENSALGFSKIRSIFRAEC